MIAMEKMKKLIAMTAVFALFSGQVQGQECTDDSSCEAYCDSGCASYMSAALPIGALAVAAIIIATTDRHHHHHSGSYSSSSHHSHSSSYSSSCNSSSR